MIVDAAITINKLPRQEDGTVFASSRLPHPLLNAPCPPVAPSGLSIRLHRQSNPCADFSTMRHLGAVSFEILDFADLGMGGSESGARLKVFKLCNFRQAEVSGDCPAAGTAPHHGPVTPADTRVGGEGPRLCWNQGPGRVPEAFGAWIKATGRCAAMALVWPYFNSTTRRHSRP